MAWKIEFDPAAQKELKKLGTQHAKRILKFLSERLALADNPRSLGAALKGATLGSLWKYRIGDYRVIVDIEDNVMRILVVRIGNRREIYKKAIRH
ncbi:mRNA interferase RelE/StbE [Zymomonas mobilis]|uniref:type II toxin-antitoxin system RelE family toxin n=1 Tax=Zymomonas mobilis TaxID=542 RepID=UPI00026D8211|nr:type II toxin-antitoxin system RelE/ParE family toxin [Zymomonas mobilis]AFN57607.1 addiction module toxin, RelE/StbE family [Zymomonas mobilis subsp. mobilis ATCC 29191]TQK75374.1 mRNA interferase RelE/StbE [Zymomonas mobilis]TQL14608.1 mRNA interferase RelE/StbE [Zymomonas mobilis]GEB88362.1 translation repressor RelE [Zymomonas mobilis subsp. mobilis]